MGFHSSRTDRAVRAVVFALVGVGLALLAHWFGSGMLPGWPVPVAATSFMGLLGWWVGSRSRGLICLVVLAVLSQMGMHAAFAWSMGDRGVATLLCGGSSHSAAGRTASMLFDAQMGRVHDGSWSTSGLPMLAAHAVAAILLGMWLRLGERVLDQAVAALGVLSRDVLVLWAFISTLTVSPHRLLSAGIDRPIPRLRGRVVGAVGLRGPPMAIPV